MVKSLLGQLDFPMRTGIQREGREETFEYKAQYLV